MKRFPSGEKAIRKVTFKIFQPDGKRLTRRATAPAGRAYSRATMETMIQDVCGEVEAAFPRHEFNLVQIGAAEFNIVCRGARASA